MANTSFKDYEIFCCEDGIYMGRALKNGTLSKDSRKIDDEEIVQMFSNFLERYCARNVTNLLEIEKNEKPYIEAKLFIR